MRDSPAQSGISKPSSRGAFAWFLSLSAVRRVVLIGAILIVGAASFYAEENWRGRQAWESCERDLVAKGVELDWRKFIPEPVSDEQNFAMTPFLAPLFDFNPRRFQPGEKLSQNAEGHDRAMNFAAALLPVDKNTGLARPPKSDDWQTDLAGALALMTNRSANTYEPPRAFSNRTEVAAAVLEAMQMYHPVLDELRAASQRPYCRFNIEYDAKDPMTILLHHLLVLRRVSKVVQIRASAELTLGKTEAAFEDAKFMFFLAEAIRQEPFLVSCEVRAGLLKAFEQIIWEGLCQRQWSEAQLREFQSLLGKPTLAKDLARGLQAERAGFGDRFFRYVRSHKNALRSWVGADDSAAPLAYLLAGPEGWFYQEQVSFQRLHSEKVMKGFDPEIGRFQPRTIDDDKQALTRDLKGSSFWRHTAFAGLVLTGIMNIFEKSAVSQTRLKEAILACAIERYRLANGKYPESLGSLVPAFIERLPLDPCNGESFKYRPGDASQFTLYGVGWNEKDDGGTVKMNQEGTAPDPDQGDWVWPPYPAK